MFPGRGLGICNQGGFEGPFSHQGALSPLVTSLCHGPAVLRGGDEAEQLSCVLCVSSELRGRSGGHVPDEVDTDLLSRPSRVEKAEKAAPGPGLGELRPCVVTLTLQALPTGHSLLHEWIGNRVAVVTEHGRTLG